MLAAATHYSVVPPFSLPNCALVSSIILPSSFAAGFSGLVTPGISGKFEGGVLDKGDARHFRRKDRS